MGNLDENNDAGKVAWLDILLVAVICSAFFGFKLGGGAVFNGDEGATALAAESVLDGHWVAPEVNGQIRLLQSPIMSWLAAGSGAIFGGVNEFSLRLVSAVLAGGIAILMTILAGRMFGRLSGILTGLCVVSSVGLLWFSHIGSDQMLTAFFVTASMVSLYFGLERIEVGKSAIGYLAIFYLMFALVAIAKGGVFMPLVIGPALWFFVWRGGSLRWRSIDRSSPFRFVRGVLGVVPKSIWAYLSKMNVAVGILIFVLIVGGWVVAVMLNVPDAADRFLAELKANQISVEASAKPVWFYLPWLFVITLPWSIFLPLGLTLPFRKIFKEKRFELMFVFIWLIVGLAVLTMTAEKGVCFILPVAGPAILLSVVAMIFSVEHLLSHKSVLLGFAAVILITSIAFVVGYGSVKSSYPELVGVYRLTAMLLICAQAVAMVACLRIHLLVSVTTMTLAIGLIFALVWSFMPKLMDAERNPKTAASVIRDATDPDVRMYAVGGVSPSLVYYFGQEMRQIPGEQVMRKFSNADKKDLDLPRLQLMITNAVVGLAAQGEHVYFVAPDSQFTMARDYARQLKYDLYEIASVPNFYSKDESLIVFSNRAKR